LTEASDFRTPSPLLDMWPLSSSQNGCSNGNNENWLLAGRLDAAKSGRRYLWCDISHDGTKAITGDAENCVLIWDLLNEKTPYLVLASHTGSVNCCKFSANDEFIVSASVDGLTIISDVATRRTVFSFDGHGKNNVSSCCWIDRGEYKNCVVTNSYADFAVWTKTGITRLRWSAETTANCMDVSKCGNYVAAGLIDGSVMVWQLERKQPDVFAVLYQSQSTALPTSINFGASNRLLVSKKDGTVEVWDVNESRNREAV